MAHRCEIECPYCGDTHIIEVPDRFPHVQGVRLRNMGLVSNHIGLFRRYCNEIERRCPNTNRFYQVICARELVRT